MPRAVWYTAKVLLGAQEKALGKAFFAVTIIVVWSLPSAALGKAFAECNMGFAECFGHSAKRTSQIVWTIVPSNELC